MATTACLHGRWQTSVHASLHALPHNSESHRRLRRMNIYSRMRQCSSCYIEFESPCFEFEYPSVTVMFKSGSLIVPPFDLSDHLILVLAFSSYPDVLQNGTMI